MKNETGSVLDEALRNPVVLTNHGRARAYIVPADRFERMLAFEDRQLVARAKRDRAGGMVGPEASMAFLERLVDAPGKPVARGKENIKDVVGKLADGAIQRLRAGKDFENLVAEMWRLDKNKTCFKNGLPSQPPGCFIPDFLVTRAGRLVEVKTSMGAVKKLQFQEFIRIAHGSGQKMSMIFLKKPTPAEVDQLQRWALEVTGETDDLLLSVIHILD